MMKLLPPLGLACSLVLTAGVSGPALADGLSLGIGGVSVGLSTSNGIEANVGVGSLADVDASIGSGGVNANVGVGTQGSLASVGVGVTTGVAPGTPPGTVPPGTTPVGVVIPGASEVRTAKARSCPAGGNSSVYNDYIAFASNGVAVGVVKSATVGSDMRIHRLTLSTLDSFSPAKCLTLSDNGITVGAAALKLSYNGNQLHNTLAAR
ncbi:MAG: hypothetical protein Q7J44_20305 [Pseudotabrizicola sp.]|uniref:hypothetical protein n=1 Tax=Pseudotabrizicola sp. TaxID=2939647 RepID=UPI00271EC47D|nr:hypothetical protein [Pseudotabrizicola sp.]MDO9640881.1 hypothetical protein [Pseudotabrizicola sp.]